MRVKRKARQVMLNNDKAKSTKLPPKEEIEVRIRQVLPSKDKAKSNKSLVE